MTIAMNCNYIDIELLFIELQHLLRLHSSFVVNESQFYIYYTEY